MDRFLGLALLCTVIALPMASAGPLAAPAAPALPAPAPTSILQVEADLVDQGGPLPHAVFFVRVGVYACPTTNALVAEDEALAASLQLVCAPDRYAAVDAGL